MKLKKLVICLAFIVSLIMVLGSCATTRQAISEQVFYITWSGTWVNTDTPGNAFIPQKIVAYPGGTHDTYRIISLTSPSCNHKITLIDQWTESKGDIWYAAIMECPRYGMEGYTFGKISDSGNTLEYIFHTSTDPIKKWEPDNPAYYYCIFYRDHDEISISKGSEPAAVNNLVGTYTMTILESDGPEYKRFAGDHELTLYKEGYLTFNTWYNGNPVGRVGTYTVTDGQLAINCDQCHPDLRKYQWKVESSQLTLIQPVNSDLLTLHPWKINN